MKRHAHGNGDPGGERVPAGDEARSAATPAADDPGAVPGAAGAPAEEEAGVLKDRWLRAEADLQNYRRRAAREREEARRNAEESVMLEVITALDDLERALATARDSGAPESWAEGVRMVVARLGDFLARQGVTPVDPLGQPFDPAFHEAVLEMEAAGVPPGHVSQVVLRGWRRGERALRAARVVVARGPGGDE
jgi:molecular chaperone GrpE